jgi:hypothetical protein
MIWVAWRQFRPQALVTLGLLAAFAVLVLVTGLHLRDVYSSLGGAHCAARNDCTALGGHDKPLADLLGPALLAIPALLGMFWGAPLVARELESGTYRLAWTQSVTRRRWLSVRVALVGVAALAVAGLASWLVSWWFAPLDAVNMNRFDPSVFTERGVVAIGYAGFAFALGVATGTLMRRTLSAMAATLLGFVAARVAVTVWVRPHLLLAKEVLASVSLGKGVGFVSSAWGVSISPGVPAIPNAWTISVALVDRAHHVLSAAQLHNLLIRACPTIAAGAPQNPAGARKGPGGPVGGAVFTCQQRLSHHVQQLATYQPASHYWPLQALETGIFLAAAFALIGATVWRVGRRAPRKPAVGEPRERTADPLGLEVAPEIGVAPVRLPEDGENSTRRHRQVTRPNRPRPRITPALPILDRRKPTIMRGRRPPILTSVVAAAAFSLLVAGCGAGGSPASRVAASNTADCSARSTCYTPHQFEAAYGILPLLNRGIDGRGETVVLPELAEPQFPLPASDIREDLARFDRLFHLPPAHLRAVTRLAPSASPWLANGEAVLDTEMVHAIAPGAVIVEVLVPATSLRNTASAVAASVAALRLGTALGAITSISAAGQTGGEHCDTHVQAATLHAALRVAARHHVTVIAASGDIGAVGEPCQVVKGLTGGAFPPVKQVNLPAADPLVLAAGGTSLTADHKTGAYISESAWGLPFGDPGSQFQASGGGLSSVIPRPSYQDDMAGIGAYRGVPDVAANASPHTAMAVVTSTGDGKYTISGNGGTSASAPTWAGLIALADQYADRHLGFVNAAISRIGRSTLYHKAFHDITSGDNTVRFPPKTIKGYQATPGWDPVTGWGSPDASVLVPLLVRYVHRDDAKGL